MTTLAALKAEIADDLDRTDITTRIASAITSAITFYQRQRFYFNETREETFSTVAAQSDYDVDDDAQIPNFLGFDALFITVSSQIRDLTPMDPRLMERLLDNSAASGEPTVYAYYNETIRLYPIPDIAYTIRMMGPMKVAAPAADATTGNRWMTDAYELIRCRAKLYLATHVLRDSDLAQIMSMAEKDALAQLLAEGTSKMGSGVLVATEF